MKMKTHTVHLIFATTLVLAYTGAALAQSNFQLPRECSERIVVNPEKCVIQDGPPRLPLVRQTPVGNTQTPAVPATTPTTAPAPRSTSAPFATRR